MNLNSGGTGAGMLADFEFSESMLASTGVVEAIPMTQKSVPDYLKPFQQKEIFTSDGQTIRLKPKTRYETTALGTSLELEISDDCGINIGELLDKIEHDESVKKSRQLQAEEAVSEQRVSDTRQLDNNVLWAEKWRPKTFFELVGNEKTNRYALRWLRRWSKCVFGEKVVADRFPVSSMGPAAVQMQYVDPFDRPEKRIMLFHGPPGIGKTSVAHVIAKQAGYETMEINASDERAGQKVKHKIENSLNSQTFSGKPVVLICDEVDGSTEGGFIRVLIDLVNQDQRATQRIMEKREQYQGHKKDRSRNKSRLLMRPIICICNDLYAHSLEKLRPYSEIVSFRKTTERTVKERLREICDKENISIDTKDLSEIVSLTNCDIRSCLNLLQFSGSLSKSGELRAKDSQINWFTVVKEILKRDPKKQRGDQYKELSRLVSANNQADRVTNGLFSLYHDVEYQDDLLKKPNEIGDWLFFFDQLNRASFELQSGDLASYCSHVPMKFFLSFSDPNNNHEKGLKPKSDYDHYELKRSNMELQRKLMSGVTLEVRSKLILSNIATQVLPFIDHLLTPEIKSPRFSLKPSDSKKLADALAILKDFGLSIETKRDERFMQQLILVPPIDEITTFNQALKKQNVAKKSSVFPILVAEIERIRHLKRKKEEDEQALESKVNKKAKAPDVTEKKFTTTLDYFKSQYDDISVATSAKKKVRDEESRIWVKYHEGFSNAVRKNINWEELWSF